MHYRAVPGWHSPVYITPPEPGDFCCMPVSGPVGVAITVGQFLDGDKFEFYDHAEVYVGQPDDAGPYGYTVSAYPNGHGRRPLPCAATELPGSIWSSGLFDVTPAQRAGICAWANAHQDTQYSFLDYGALFLHMLRIPAPGLQAYIRSTGHQICSQFTDAACAANGLHLFTDGRWPGYVKPGDLAKLLEQRIRERAPGRPAQPR